MLELVVQNILTMMATYPSSLTLICRTTRGKYHFCSYALIKITNQVIIVSLLHISCYSLLLHRTTIILQNVIGHQPNKHRIKEKRAPNNQTCNGPTYNRSGIFAIYMLNCRVQLNVTTPVQHTKKMHHACRATAKMLEKQLSIRKSPVYTLELS